MYGGLLGLSAGGRWWARLKALERIYFIRTERPRASCCTKNKQGLSLPTGRDSVGFELSLPWNVDRVHDAGG